MDRTRSQTFSRGLKVLADLNTFGGATATEIAARTKIHRVIVGRLLNTLVADGYVRREGRPGRHYLCATVQSLADGFVPEAWVNDIARPLVMDLGQRMVWPLSLAVNAGTEMRICVATDPESPLTRRRIPLGFRVPTVASAAGLVYLAFAAPRVRQMIIGLAQTEFGSGSATLTTRLAEARSRGYALWHSPEKITHIAVPVLAQRRPVAALVLRYYTSAMTITRALSQFLGELRTCADAIGARLPASDIR